MCWESLSALISNSPNQTIGNKLEVAWQEMERHRLLGPRGQASPRAVASYGGGSSLASENLTSRYGDSHSGKE